MLAADRHRAEFAPQRHRARFGGVAPLVEVGDAVTWSDSGATWSDSAVTWNGASA